MMVISIDEIKTKAIPILKNGGVSRASLFGSTARGERREDSDIDILVDLPKGASLFDIADLQIKLEDVFQTPVDLITYNSLNPLIKSYIMQDQLSLI